MPLTPLPDQGIEVPLSEYNRLRAFQGGGWFWDHDNQQIIRETLGDFLPRVEERRDRGGALFQQFVGGVEATSRSQAIGAQMNRVPKSEYNRLQRALENLKLKAQSPSTDPNARRVIEKFCLPDPAKDPDLYRLYGSRWNRRLLVLWGCEREEGSSLAPASALTKMPVEPVTASFMRRLPLWLGLLLLLLLLALGLREVWQRNHPNGGDGSPVATTGAPSGETAAPSGVSTPGTGVTPAPANGNTAPGLAAANHPVPVDPSAPSPALAGTRNMPYLPDNVPANGSDATKPPPNNQNVPPGDMTTTPPSAREMSAHNPPNGEGTPAPSQVLSSPASAGSTRNVGAASPHPARDATTLASPVAAPAAVAPNQSDNSPASTTQPTPRADTLHPGGANAPQDAEETSNADAAPIPPAAGSPGSMPASAGDPTMPAPSLDPGTPPTVEILKAQASASPHDGKLDMVLMATAHEADNTLTPLQITHWNVDGKPQHDRSGHDVTSGQVSLSLPPGKHRVGVTGTARGLPVEFETDVEVLIKSQGDVTIKGRGSK